MSAPEHIESMLLVRGGTNDYGEPNYRLVRTEGRKRMAGGLWHDWQKGTDIRYRNAEINRCLRSYVGMKAVPMYPGEHGWVLERWMPPVAYGSPVLWNLPMDMGGTKRWMGLEHGYILSCGPFPHRGDYEGTGYLFPNEALSEALIANAVGRIERERDGMPGNLFQRALNEINAEEQEEAARDADFERYAHEVMGDDLDFMNVHSLGARAEANRFAESKGIRSEVF